MKLLNVVFVLAVIGLPQAFGQVRHMHGGKVQDAPTVSLPMPVGAKVLVWSDKKYYLPGEQIMLRALGFAADAEQLQIFVSERFTDSQGNAVSSSYNFCDCGDSNGGSVPSLTNNNFITLLSERVPSNRLGRYDFVVNIMKFVGSNAPAVQYQTTRLTVFAMINNTPENNPIAIDQMQQGVAQGPILYLTGKFPVNTLLYYFSGAAPYEGSFSSIASTDGTHLIVPSWEGAQIEGRVVLMLPDGSFSTTSAQTFVPALGNAASASTSPVSVP